MSDGALRTTIHARITPDVESGYVATCEEIAVVTQGETLDEVTANLRDAVALHLDGENLAALGFAAEPTILVTLELAPTHA
jgi:predicted RNase H-like HicB family nuclease